MAMGGAAISMLFAVKEQTTKIASSVDTNAKRLEVLEEFAGKGPRVTLEDLDDRAREIVTVYANLNDRILDTQNQILEIQREQAGLLNRLDERLKATQERVNENRDAIEKVRQP
jgi:chromosome segregation ATPase